MTAMLTQTAELPTGAYTAVRRTGGWVLSGPHGDTLGKPYPTWAEARRAAVTHDARERGSNRTHGGRYERWHTRRSRRTGVEARVLDLTHPDSTHSSKGPRWASECVTHGVLARHHSCTAARDAIANTGEWCPACQQAVA